MRFKFATIALVGLGNVFFSVNSVPTTGNLSQRGPSLDTPNGVAERAFTPPKVAPKPEPEPVEPKPGPSEPKPAPITPHPAGPANPGGPSRPATENLDPDTATTYTPKAVPPLNGLGAPKPYQKILVGPDDPAHEDIDPKQWPKVYNIKSKNYPDDGGVVDKIGVNTDRGSVSIFNAQNKNDEAPIAQKLYLSDIVMSVFTAEGKKPSDLNLVHADQVINKDSQPVFESIYEAMGKNVEEDWVIFRSTDTGVMKSYFDRISNTPFPKVTQRMNGDFSTGKTILQYILSPHGGGPSDDTQNLDIVLG